MYFQVVKTYPCLYGLDDCSYKKKIYSITLTSIAMNTSTYQEHFKCGPSNCSMTSLTYTVSVVPGNFNQENFRPEIYLNHCPLLCF